MLLRRAAEFRSNPLIASTDPGPRANLLQQLCEALADHRGSALFEETRYRLADIEQRLDEHLGPDYLQRYRPADIAGFYIHLALHASILSSLYACLEAQQAIDWTQLREARF